VRKNISCLLIEKKQYPFHRVCGEYISNEAKDFLERENLFPSVYNPPIINEFLLSSVSGRFARIPLDLGGFGISRYAFDHFLYERAKKEGVIVLHDEVESIEFREGLFEIRTTTERLLTPQVVGAFGKRSLLDAKLKRSFFQKRSPYLGIKYHVRTAHSPHLIALHNFEGGYCGISNVEEGKTNVCYLIHRDVMRKFKNIQQMEEAVLYKNPHLRKIFTSSEFLFDKPEVINEVSFETKEPVFNHILMAGDAAGMIAPLCGNGMAMAIRSAKLLSNAIELGIHENWDRQILENVYTKEWNHEFAGRLKRGRLIQHYLFGSHLTSQLAVNIALQSKWLTNQIIKSTHGQVF
jgi:flavin-dependent dehydrogenase